MSECPTLKHLPHILALRHPLEMVTITSLNTLLLSQLNSFHFRFIAPSHFLSLFRWKHFYMCPVSRRVLRAEYGTIDAATSFEWCEYGCRVQWIDCVFCISPSNLP
jgi:hypothetical protein